MLFSLHIRSMWETTVMHKQVSGWTVNFGPNFPDQSLLWNTPPPISENFRFGMTKVYSEIPPHFRKLQIWDDQSLLRNAPPPTHFRKLQIWDDQSLLRNTPPPTHFRKLQIWDDQSLLRNTPPPHFRKLQIWDDQSLLRNTPPHPRVLECRELIHVETLSNRDNYSLSKWETHQIFMQPIDFEQSVEFI